MNLPFQGVQVVPRFLLPLVLLLAGGSSMAQDQSVDPAAEAGTATADEESAGETPGDEEMPETLRSPIIEFLAIGPILQAHKLRGLTAEVAALILGSQSGGDIAFEAIATPLRGTGNKAYVPLFIEIDGHTFLQSNQSTTARVEVYAYALADDRQVISFLAEAFAVDVQELGEAVWQRGLKYYGHLELPPGEYQVRILVRNYQSAAAALREIELTVPDFNKLEQPYIFPVFRAPEGRETWLPVREWQGPSEYPLWIAGQAVSPEARPVLVAGRRSQGHILAYGLGAGVARGRIELLRAGVAVASTALDIAATREPDKVAEPETVAVAFDSPQVTPGVYSLRVELNGATSATIPVLVLQQGIRDRALLWTDMRRQLRSGVGTREETAAPPRTVERKVTREAEREQRQILELASSYRRALALLGRGNGSAARSALLEIESGALTEDTLRTLKSAQLTVAEQLSNADVESLVPMLALHGDLYSTYSRRRLYSLGFHAREMIELLAELYAKRGGTPGSHVVAARALASLGGYLHAANLPSSSRRLYRQALTHDSHNRAALLGLATSYERYGDYTQSVAVLEDLAMAHPSFGEGLLRLAVNLNRLGVRNRARGLLEQVIELDAPNWVRSIAYQELARMLLDTGDLAGAAELLGSSIEDIPDQHGAIYLLAHVYDRQRRPYESLEVLQTLVPPTSPAPSLDRETPVASSTGASARKIYDSCPMATLDMLRLELAGAAAVRAPLLAQMLDDAAEKQ